MVELPCVYGFPGEILHNTVAEQVIHYRVHLIAPQYIPAVLPGLGYQQGVLPDAFDRPPEFLPEGEIPVIGDIQPPSVDIRDFDPVGRDIDEILPDLGIVKTELRHSIVISYAFIIGRVSLQGKAFNDKPILVPGRLSFPKHILKRFKAVSAVVENPVKHYLDISPMAFLYQFNQFIRISEGRIYFIIIRSVILMIAWRLEQGFR